MKTKICTVKKCSHKGSQPTDNFYNNKNFDDGLDVACKDCRRSAGNKLYIKYKDKIQKKNKKWAEDHPERMTELQARWYQSAKSERNKKERERRKNDPVFRISKNISTTISGSLRNGKTGKNRKHWEDLVGYTLQELKDHLEPLFESGMTWDNYGKDGWHLDHIKPRCLFKYMSYDDDEFKQCWALTNLQPLWAEDNLKKGNKFTE